MKKKYHYEIVLNDGKPIHEPLAYKYRSTSNIELHILFDKARIIFEQSVFYSALT